MANVQVKMVLERKECTTELGRIEGGTLKLLVIPLSPRSLEAGSRWRLIGNARRGLLSTKKSGLEFRSRRVDGFPAKSMH